MLKLRLIVTRNVRVEASRDVDGLLAENEAYRRFRAKVICLPARLSASRALTLCYPDYHMQVPDGSKRRRFCGTLRKLEYRVLD